MIKAILFDLDGTLVNSLRDLYAAVGCALSFYGNKMCAYEDFTFLVGNGNLFMIKSALPENRRDEKTVSDTLEKFFEYYKGHCADETRRYPGITELLAFIRKNGIKTAVVTNKAQAMTDAVVSALFESGTFSAVCGQREGVPVKPDPALCFIAAKELGVTPAECLFVGDSANDINVAKNFGCKSVGVLWGFRNRAELEKAGADYIVSDPSEIAEIISDKNNC